MLESSEIWSKQINNAINVMANRDINQTEFIIPLTRQKHCNLHRTSKEAETEIAVRLCAI